MTEIEARSSAHKDDAAPEANPLGEALARDTELVRHRYDRGARLYDVQVWPMELMLMARFRRRLITLASGPRVLEVGVGTGKNLPLYAPQVEVEAIDFSPGMLARAQRKELAPNIHLRLMDVQRLAFPDDTFDTVVSTCVFCSVPGPVRGLQEIRRVLHPSGRALFLEHVRPGTGWLAALFDRLDPIVSRAGPHINRRTIENIRAAGLEIEREENLFSDILKLVVARAPRS